MLEKKEFLGKKNKAVIGYDLNNEYALISYLFLEETEPETLATIAGTQSYNIPAVLCKRKEVSQWFYGREALKTAEEGNGILVEGLLDKALSQEEVTVGAETFSTAAMLALFIKRSLSMLTMMVPSEQIAAFMITVDNLDRQMIQMLTQAVSALALKPEQIYFQSHMESFYHYVVHQQAELWTHQVGLCDFSGGMMKTYRMECNRKTVPTVAFIEEKKYPHMVRETSGRAPADESRFAWLDTQFTEVVRELIEGRILSTIFLIGVGFGGGWNKESL